MPPRTGSLEERLKARMEAERRRLGLAAKEVGGGLRDIGAGVTGAAREAPGVLRDVGAGLAGAASSIWDLEKRGLDILKKPFEGVPLKEYPETAVGGLRDIAAGGAKAVGETIKAVGEYTPIGEPRQAAQGTIAPTTQAPSVDATGLASYSAEQRAKIAREQEAVPPLGTAASGLRSPPPDQLASNTIYIPQTGETISEQDAANVLIDREERAAAIERMTPKEQEGGVLGQGRVFDPVTKQFVDAPSMSVAGAQVLGGTPGTGLRGGIYQATPAATSMADYAQQRAATNVLMQTGAGSTRQAQERVRREATRTEGLATQRRTAMEGQAEQARLNRESAEKVAQITASNRPEKEKNVELEKFYLEQATEKEFGYRQIDQVMKLPEIEKDRKGRPTQHLVWSKNGEKVVAISNRDYETFLEATPEDTIYMALTPNAQDAAEFKAQGIEFGIDAEGKVRRV